MPWPLLSLLLCAPTIDPATQQDPLPRVRGSVVRDEDCVPIEGAAVEPKGVGVGTGAVTDAKGDFELSLRARCREAAPYNEQGIDYVRISAPGRGVALLDPC